MAPNERVHRSDERADRHGVDAERIEDHRHSEEHPDDGDGRAGERVPDDGRHRGRRRSTLSGV